MSAPRNPYRDRAERAGAGAISDLGGELSRLSPWARPDATPAPSIERAVGLHSIDLHNIAIRNYRAGVQDARAEGLERAAELEDQVVAAWDEGYAAGIAYADERAQAQVEAVLRLIAAKLEPQKGVSDTMARRAADELVRGALVVLVDPEGESDGLGVSGFEALENALKDAAQAEDANEQPEE